MKTKKVLVGLVACLALTMIQSCSDDTKPVIDFDFMDSLTRGSSAVCYEYESSTTYEQKAGETKWKEIDPSDWVGGGGAPGDRKILIMDGKSWSPLGMFSCVYGFHPLAFPMLAYRNKTGFSGSIYIAREFEFDDQNNTMTIDHSTFDIIKADKDGMTLVGYTYMGNNPEEWTTWKWVMNYKRSVWEPKDMDENPRFDSAYEACLGIIEMLRAEFGNVFNINPYIEPDFSFGDNPMIDLDKLADKCRERPEYF